MQLSLSLVLPRDEQTIPVTRHIVQSALDELGALPHCRDDIAIAQTEACSNVVHHSGPGDEYEVRVDIGPEKCVIRVVDTGRGFDSESLAVDRDGAGPDLSAERGRGIALMRALVDEVRFVSKPEAGTIVHLEKSVSYAERSPMESFRRSAELRA